MVCFLVNDIGWKDSLKGGDRKRYFEGIGF